MRTQLRFDASRAQAHFRACLGALVLVTALLPAPAFGQAGGVPKDNPRLASLSIEIWPEYDRPAALVILNGALAESVKLPAAVTLRLPVSSGGAAAVAYSAASNGNLLNLKHEVASAGEFIMLKFETPERFFHVEYYEPMATSAPERTVRYVWPGDLAVERASVVVQEPASATDMSVEPNLPNPSTGKDGLHYRAADLGALEAGKRLPITVRYTKRDARPSVEILPAKSSAPASQSTTTPTAAPASTGLPEWLLPLAGFAMLSLVGVGFLLWWGRRRVSAAAESARPACAKCGAAQVPTNRFCGNCGAKLR